MFSQASVHRGKGGGGTPSPVTGCVQGEVGGEGNRPGAPQTGQGYFLTEQATPRAVSLLQLRRTFLLCSRYSHFRAAHQMGKCVKESKDEDFINDIAETFNNTLKFDPRLLKMAYTVRDPVPHGTYFLSSLDIYLAI